MTKDDSPEKVTQPPRAKAHNEIPTFRSEEDPRERSNTLDGAEMIGAGPAKKKEKKKEYDDDGICKICLENPIDTVIVECGHQVICESCTPLVGALVERFDRRGTELFKLFTENSFPAEFRKFC